MNFFILLCLIGLCQSVLMIIAGLVMVKFGYFPGLTLSKKFPFIDTEN